MKDNISETEARNALIQKEHEAEEMLKDEKKVNDFLEKAFKLLEKIKKIPIIGSLVDDITTTIELIRDYIKGDYKKVPVRIIVSALAALIYLVSPIDLIPDGIPFLGFVDDAAIITLVLSTGLSFELSKFRKSKEEMKRAKIIEDARKEYFAEYDNINENLEEVYDGNEKEF